jgi:ABC-type transporter MlaC component
MKKILFFVVAMVAVFAASSCEKKGPSAADTALKSVELLKNKEYSAYTDLVYFHDSITSDSAKLASKKDSYKSMLEKNFKDKAEKQGEIKEYKLIENDEKDSIANVKIEVLTTKDIKDTMDVKLRKDRQGEWKIESKK